MINEKRIKCYSQFNNKSYNDKQKIGLIIQETYIASNYIRILSPFSNLNHEEYVPILIDERDFHIFKKDLENDNLNLDIIIVQRDVLTCDFANLLVEKCKLFGINLILDLDDDLINLDKTSSLYKSREDKLKCMNFLAENSDCITVSTPNLREKMLIFNENVTVIPNALVDYWKIKKNINIKKSSKIIKIGYMGTRTHTNDLKIIEESITNIQKKYSDKKIIFEVIEGTTDKISCSNTIPIPKENKDYPNFVPWLQDTVDWDIAIAPLSQDNIINFSKSELKYLEYTALNVPGVYSAVGPYEYSIVHEKNGMLVKENSTKEWEQHITKLIDDETLRSKIITNAWKHVESEYLLNNLVNNWINVLNMFKRDKNSILYQKVEEYYTTCAQIPFNEFLINESENIIKNSKLFDEVFYKTKYPDVNQTTLTPIQYYLKFGHVNNHLPNKHFKYSLKDKYSLIYNFNLNPLVYNILYKNNYSFKNIVHTDKKLNEKIIKKQKIFNSKNYLNEQKDVRESGLDPIYHYVNYGYKENRNPTPYFYNKYYTEKYLSNTEFWNPLTHYILIGKKRGYSTNPWEIINKNYSIVNINQILKNVSKKISIILPIFNYSDNVVKCIKSIINNTFGNYELIIFINNHTLIDFDNFNYLKKDKIKIVSFEDDDYLEHAKKIISNIENDIILLNSYSEVTFNWLNKLTVKAYSSNDIDLVSPLSNFIIDINPFSENFEENEFNLTPHGIDTLLKKISEKRNIKLGIGDGFCIYIKNRCLNELNISSNLFYYNPEYNSFYINIPKSMTHIIDDSVYVHHNLSFFEDNKSVLTNINENFFTDLKIKKNLNKTKIQQIKTNLKNSIKYDKQYSLDSRILYILDEKNFNYFKDIICYYSSQYYECYYLTEHNNLLKLWKNSQLVKEWDLTSNLKNKSKTDYLKEIYFNILYTLNINILHLIDFNLNYFELIKIADALNIHTILNCTNNNTLSQYLTNNNNAIDYNDSMQVKLFNLINNYDLIIDENNNKPCNSNKLIKLIKNFDYDSRLVNIYDDYKSKFCSLLFVGKLTDDDEILIKNLKQKNGEYIDFHFFGNDELNLNPYGNNHGTFDLTNFKRVLSKFKPNFVVISNKISKFYEIIYESKLNNVPVLLDDSFKDLPKEYPHCIITSLKSNDFTYNSILDLKNSKMYYDMIKEMILANEIQNSNIINITNCFFEMYSKNIDKNTKEISYKHEDPKKLKKSHSNFKRFLLSTHNSSLFTLQTNKEYSKFITIMEGIRENLKTFSITEFPLVSIIMVISNEKLNIYNAIDSVLWQTYSNFELLIIDSKHKSTKFISNISDTRIKVIFCEETTNIATMYNIGLKNANGKYIFYINNNNEWDNNYIYTSISTFLQFDDADAIYSGQLLFKNTKETPFAVNFSSFNKQLLFYGNYIDLTSFAHKKEIYEIIGGFNETFINLFAWEFFLRISEKFEIYSIPILLSKYYINSLEDYFYNNNLLAKNEKINEEFFKITSKNNTCIKEQDKLKRKIHIIIYNIKNLNELQDCIKNILSLNLKKMIKISIVESHVNEHMTNYINDLKLKIDIKVIYINNQNIISLLQNITQCEEEDILLMDVNTVIKSGTLELMQKSSNNLSESGIIIPCQIISKNNSVRGYNPYLFNLDSINDNKISADNLNIISNGNVFELDLPITFCMYFKTDVLNMISIVNEDSNYSSSEILADYIHYIKNLKIYLINNANIYYNKSNKQLNY